LDDKDKANGKEGGRMKGILEGIRVVDMGHFVAVPAAGAMLGDWGAEVIKVEPLSGERVRQNRRYHDVEKVIKCDGGEVDWVIQLHNRNKMSLALDLKKEPGRDILYKLVKRSDVFMSNYELGALKRLKLDYATLSQYNPKIVYAVLTAYGTAGPDKDERGFDFSAAWASSGMQYLIGEPGSPPPPQRGGMMDRVAGAHIVAGILAALLHREKTGKGQEMEFSLYHAAVWTLAADIQGALMGRPLAKHDRTKAVNPLFNSYRAKDDRWFQLVVVSDTDWSDLCRAIDMPELENDPRFDSRETREQHREALIRILDEIFASKNREEWEKRFRKNNLIYGRVQAPIEVTTDPQALANNFFADIHHPVAGQMKLVTTPVKFCQNPASLRVPAPEVGQHTEEILLELGYNRDDVTQLKGEGVILDE
jgi:crotonobetainyl-CoA:carnitine CoA-transferase CaiB-like acyl-CoA transferase